MTDEPFLSALVDSWPDLQHEQVGSAVCLPARTTQPTGEKAAQTCTRYAPACLF